MNLTSMDGPPGLSYDFYFCAPPDIWKLIILRFIEDKKDFVALKYVNKFFNAVLNYELYHKFNMKYRWEVFKNMRNYCLYDHRTSGNTCINWPISQCHNPICIQDVDRKMTYTYKITPMIRCCYFVISQLCSCGNFSNSRPMHMFDFPDDDLDAIPYIEQHNYIQYIEKIMRIIRTKYLPILIHTAPASSVRLIITPFLYDERGKVLNGFCEYSEKIILITDDFAYITKYCNDIVMELTRKYITRYELNQ